MPKKVDPKGRFQKVDLKSRFQKVYPKVDSKKVYPKVDSKKVNSKGRFQIKLTVEMFFFSKVSCSSYNRVLLL